MDVVAALLLLVGICAYAVLGGADFGGGFWDLFAGGDRRGARQRALIERSIAPVWEPNHIWLIFVLVVAWTAFPSAFAAVGSTLYVPLFLAALGIIFRGAAFAFRESVSGVRQRRLFGVIFASSSIITPFFFGAIIGAIASGRVPAGGDFDAAFSSWTGPVSILGGVIAVVVTAYLGAAYLAADADRSGERDLAAAFRTRALGAGIVAGAIAVIGIFVLREEAPTLYDGLTAARGLPWVILSALAGIATLALLARWRLQLARVTGAAAVVAMIFGWGFGSYPWMLVDTLKISDAAGATVTLVSVVAAVAAGALILVPSLVYLYRLDLRGVFDVPLADDWAEHAADDVAVSPAETRMRGPRLPRRAGLLAALLLLVGIVLIEIQVGPTTATYWLGVIAFFAYFGLALLYLLTPETLGRGGPDWKGSTEDDEDS